VAVKLKVFLVSKCTLFLKLRCRLMSGQVGLIFFFNSADLKNTRVASGILRVLLTGP
jgi:hypothetical protein